MPSKGNSQAYVGVYLIFSFCFTGCSDRTDYMTLRFAKEQQAKLNVQGSGADPC
jgi:hypothetical protein